ncbi:ATP-binding protein [Psychromonas sp. L1A2]|uniref:ATP-binding protein n=1 Tax=Psychromonas sp. L1A2 TaxID=2686356 RepID=UPI00135C1B8B|nr:ATP-binding protein [Psychromonas sp. L1A2]
MRSSVSFQTRARTIDHLGREQIADCPTAISELWKNAYDAYAQKVELHLFDGDISVAALVDDGHGMSRDEFESKWLTIGTESKTSEFEIALDDRNGLQHRAKQGQKGIGRLSSAALGSLLLIVSKRTDHKFVAALIDWRLFENPYLLLQDIRIPITDFELCHNLIDELPNLFDQLMGNVWGDGDDEGRDKRLNEAWKRFEEQESLDGKEKSTKDEIVNTLISDVFSERHFDKWPLWNNDTVQGTAMFMANLNDDLKYQLSKTPIKDADGAEILARDRFFQTLSNFTDPFSKEDEPQSYDFINSVTAWHGKFPKALIDEAREFDIATLESLEHVIEGHVDADGYFKGRVKVFGEWYENYLVKPKVPYKTRRDSAFGEFHIRLGTFELQIGSTSLPDNLHSTYVEQAEKYAGFRVYRDGLRVMPYGRVDSDYFEVEFRRSKHAGRYFWANRRMFGRIAITREGNPNLKDKAGREGFIENKASKLFREIVENILLDVADKHLGTKSPNRKETINDIKEQKEIVKAEADRKTLQTKERKRIRSSIDKNSTALITHVSNIKNIYDTYSQRESLNSLDELQKLKIEIDILIDKTRSYSLTPIPNNLGRLEEDYRAYRKQELQAKEYTNELSFFINKAISEATEKTDTEKAQEAYRSKVASINASITKYASDGKAMLAKQTGEFDSLIKECRERYKATTFEYLEDLKLEKITLNEVLDKLDEDQEKIVIENSQKLSPYVTALTLINEQIDLEGLAIYSMNETMKYRQEINRLHALAQLGITVEIIGHEIEGLDMTISRGVNLIASGELSDRQRQSCDDVIVAQQSLSDKWRFLSPLKLSGDKTSKQISGKDIFSYTNTFFKDHFTTQQINFTATNEFLSLSIWEKPSNIYPVFINLINNSQYWVERNEVTEKQINLDVRDQEVIISDSGPGVDKDDLEQLFTLFFTRKQRGGRGIGLYLCKQNLQAGGHKIRYETLPENKKLLGANFAIEFKGMNNA